MRFTCETITGCWFSGSGAEGVTAHRGLSGMRLKLRDVISYGTIPAGFYFFGALHYWWANFEVHSGGNPIRIGANF